MTAIERKLQEFIDKLVKENKKIAWMYGYKEQYSKTELVMSKWSKYERLKWAFSFDEECNTKSVGAFE